MASEPDNASDLEDSDSVGFNTRRRRSDATVLSILGYRHAQSSLVQPKRRSSETSSP
jgi:hypothetical protein